MFDVEPARAEGLDTRPLTEEEAEGRLIASLLEAGCGQAAIDAALEIHREKRAEIRKPLIEQKGLVWCIRAPEEEFQEAVSLWNEQQAYADETYGKGHSER